MPTATDLLAAAAAAAAVVVVVVGETMSGVSSQFLPITTRSYPGAGLVQAADLLISPPCLHRQGSAPKLVHISFLF